MQLLQSLPSKSLPQARIPFTPNLTWYVLPFFSLADKQFAHITQERFMI